MQIEGAIIKEQGITFGIVIVRSHVLNNSSESESIRRQVSRIDIFSRIPIILMAQDSRGIPTYQGRPDIVKFLASIDFRRIPWKKYTIS